MFLCTGANDVLVMEKMEGIDAGNTPNARYLFFG